MSWFKRQFKLKRLAIEHDNYQEAMFYNPDPLSNRVGTIMRLSKEIEFCQDLMARQYLEEAMATMLESIRSRSVEPMIH